jgi:predicted P-loop ATPase
LNKQVSSSPGFPKINTTSEGGCKDRLCCHGYVASIRRIGLDIGVNRVTARIDIEGLADDRDQLFAEVVYCFEQGDEWWPDKSFEQEIIMPEQSARLETDAWEETIGHFLNGQTRVTVLQVARGALGIETSRLGTMEQRRITQVMEQLGWRRLRREGKARPWGLNDGHDAV